MGLPLVNPFATPYEAWSTRKLSRDETMERAMATGRMTYEVDDQLLAIVSTAREAAVYMGNGCADQRLENHIDRALASDPAFAVWRASMPSQTPHELSRYQRLYPQFGTAKVEAAIEAHGVVLSEGQFLIHAGLWPDHNPATFVTDRPLSTTFSPLVALLNASHKSKAFYANRIDLMVLHVHQPRTKVFSFRTRGTDKGHEKETLFASGATLHLINRELVGEYPVGNMHGDVKDVPVYVLDVAIS
jgi:hypothetical protein